MESLSELILAEYSRPQADFIADIVIQKPSLLGELIDIVFQNSEPISRRASWPLRIISDRDATVIQPFVAKIIQKIPNVTCESIRRSLLALLVNTPIPEEMHGELLQFTFEILTDKGSPVAASIYSTDIFYKLSVNEPDLLNELKLILEDLIPYGSAGVRSKCRKTIKKIERRRI